MKTRNLLLIISFAILLAYSAERFIDGFIRDGSVGDTPCRLWIKEYFFESWIPPWYTAGQMRNLCQNRMMQHRPDRVDSAEIARFLQLAISCRAMKENNQLLSWLKCLVISYMLKMIWLPTFLPTSYRFYKCLHRLARQLWEKMRTPTVQERSLDDVECTSSTQESAIDDSTSSQEEEVSRETPAPPTLRRSQRIADRDARASESKAAAPSVVAEATKKNEQTTIAHTDEKSVFYWDKDGVERRCRHHKILKRMSSTKRRLEQQPVQTVDAAPKGRIRLIKLSELPLGLNVSQPSRAIYFARRHAIKAQIKIILYKIFASCTAAFCASLFFASLPFYEEIAGLCFGQHKLLSSVVFTLACYGSYVTGRLIYSRLMSI